MSRQSLPLSVVRALALHAQGLAALPDSDPSRDTIYKTVEQIGCIQIDTLHVVNRSQYLVLWSRLGCYDTADFDRLIYDAEHRHLFEYWQHAASIIPLADYRFSLPKMRNYRSTEGYPRWQRWLENPENIALIDHVRGRIQQEGALRGSDFEYNGPRRDSWWDWKPAKLALEYLYNCGELMIADRIHFHRVYDLAERVLPDWVDTTEPAEAERLCYRIEQGAKMLGICEPAQAADYTYLSRNTARPYLKALQSEGVLVGVEAELADGTTRELVVHRDTLPLVEQAADGAVTACRTTFLSPFDSLFWARSRDQQFWDFRQMLEAYKPEPQREWGYFCLAILHHDRLVGRFDPKVDRKTGTLRLKALYLEPGVDPDEELVAGVAAALRDFMAFHSASDLVIEKSSPSIFGERLARTL